MSAGSAAVPHDEHAQSAKPGEMAVGVVIGRTSEFFDFFVYAIASVLVFPKLVFPFVNALQGTLYSFLIFALAFVVRPIGTALFLRIERVYGRGLKLSITLLLLGSSTVAIAFVPAYSSVGTIAVVALIVFRIGQGLAFGGSWDGLPSLLAINAPANRRGWYAMLPQLGAPLGFIIASSLFAYFESSLSDADFGSWGWRYPFFVAFAINVVALFARLRIVVTKEYEELFERGDLQPSPLPEAVRAEGRNILIGAFAPLASFALFHTVTVFPLSWVYLFTHQSTTRFLMIEVAGAVVGTGSILLSGVLADRFGRRSLLSITAGGIAAFSGFAPQLLGAGELGSEVFMMVGFALLGLSFGQSSGVLASAFQTRYRYSSSALTSDLAWLIGAGFAPWVALSLSSRFGLPAAGGYLLSGAISTLVALAVYRQLEAHER